MWLVLKQVFHLRFQFTAVVRVLVVSLPPLPSVAIFTIDILSIERHPTNGRKKVHTSSFSYRWANIVVSEWNACNSTRQTETIKGFFLRSILLGEFLDFFVVAVFFLRFGRLFGFRCFLADNESREKEKKRKKKPENESKRKKNYCTSCHSGGSSNRSCASAKISIWQIVIWTKCDVDVCLDVFRITNVNYWHSQPFVSMLSFLEIFFTFISI